MKKITCVFVGRPGDEKDKAAHNIIATWGGKVTGSGTMLIPPYERDIEAEVPGGGAYIRCCNELLRAGFRVSDMSP